MGLLSSQNVLKSLSPSASCACRLSEYYLFTGDTRNPRHGGVKAALWPPVFYIIVTDPEHWGGKKRVRGPTVKFKESTRLDASLPEKESTAWSET
jgi:hypothetical protein